jgi:hypothetical protein
MPLANPERATRNEIQSVFCQLDGSSGQTHFQLLYLNFTTALLAASSSAAQVEAALEALPVMNDVSVSTSVDRWGSASATPDAACSTGGSFMMITFLGALVGDQPELGVSHPSLMQVTELRRGTAADVQQVVCVGNAASSFTLSFEGFITAVIPAAGNAVSGTTLARKIQEELEALPTLGQVDVQLVRGADARGMENTADFCASGSGNSLIVTFISREYNYGRQPLLTAAAAAGTPSFSVASVQSGAQPSYGIESPASPSVWDASRIFGCVCDTYLHANGSRQFEADELAFYGPACQFVRCPYGVNPRYPYLPGAPNSNKLQFEKQIMFCQGELTSSFYIEFRGQRSSIEILGSSSSSDLADALRSLSTIGDVTVECAAGSVCSHTGARCSIGFVTEIGDLPSLRAVPVSPGLANLPPDVYFWEDLKGTGEAQECSGRGRCSAEDGFGICKCEDDYMTSGGPGKLLGARGDCGYQRKYRHGSL